MSTTLHRRLVAMKARLSLAANVRPLPTGERALLLDSLSLLIEVEIERHPDHAVEPPAPQMKFDPTSSAGPWTTQTAPYLRVPEGTFAPDGCPAFAPPKNLTELTREHDDQCSGCGGTGRYSSGHLCTTCGGSGWEKHP